MVSISFIVPIFNTSLHLVSRCIKSILNQKTIYSFEIIIINDGSNKKNSDLYLKFISKLKTKQKIIYKYIANSGLSIARNIGVNCSTGQFIAFVDSDDYIRSNYVNEIILNFKKHKDIDFIKFNFYFKNKFSVKKHINLLEKYEDQAYVFYKNDLRKYLLFKIWETSWSGVYKKAFLIKNNIFHINEKLFHEDTSFFIILINISKKWLILNKFLYVYDQSKSTITKNKNYEMRLEHIYRNIYYANEFIKNNTKNKMIYYDRFAYSWCNFPIKYLSD